MPRIRGVRGVRGIRIMRFKHNMHTVVGTAYSNVHSDEFGLCRSETPIIWLFGAVASIHVRREFRYPRDGSLRLVC